MWTNVLYVEIYGCLVHRYTSVSNMCHGGEMALELLQRSTSAMKELIAYI
jgi:hypothetical protein